MTLNLEDYLLVMWEYCESFGKVRESDISKRLKVSPPTVNEYIKKIELMGLAARKSREVVFTQAGRRFTIPLVRAHRIAEVFAQKILEIPWEEVHKGVMDLEHLFSGNYGENLYKHLGFPKACPHGNPVSVLNDGGTKNALLLSEGSYTLERVVFEDFDLLSRLANASIFPGTSLHYYRDGDPKLESDNGIIRLSGKEPMMIHLKPVSKRNDNR